MADNEPKLIIRPMIYSRVVGYYMPVENWNKGKVQEWKDRKTYDLTRPTAGASTLT